MDRFSESFLTEIKAKVPISEVIGQSVSWDKEKTLAQKGDWWAPCPFHNESTPSFHCEDAKGTYHCFGCGVGGDHIRFLTDSDGLTFPAAVERLAEMAGVAMPENGRQAPQERREAPPMDDEPPEPPSDEPTARKVPVKGYRYTDRDGNPLYEVIRYQFKLPDGSWKLKNGEIEKTFLQRRLVDGGYVYNLGDLTHTIYRHREVEMAIAEGKTIYLPEGEKDVETLESLGLVATTNSGGAKNWTPALALLFKDADVVILVDNDDVGRARGEAVALSLRGIARRIRVLDLAPHWPEIENKQDISDWVGAGGTASKLGEIVTGLPDWRPAAPKSTFGAKSMGNIAGSKIVYDWLIKGLIERGGVFIVAGEKQAGKSFFIMDMGMKIARGIDYGGRKVKQGLVIYMACEDPKGVEMRAEGYRRHNRIDGDLPFIVMDQGFTLMSDDAIDRFIAECLAWQAYFGLKLELITIDTFSVATEGLDEIHSGEVGKVLSRVNRIAAGTGSAVCLVHHLNGEGKRVRGHSSLTANVSQVIEIRQMTKFQSNRNAPVEHIKDSDGRIVRQALLEKNKNGPNQLKWRFILRKVDLGLDDDGFEISTCVCDPPSSEVGESTSRSKLSPDQKLVHDALLSATYDEPVDMVGSLRKATTEKAFIAHLRKVWNFRAPIEESEARTKELSDVLKRNVTALMNNSYVQRDNEKGIIWSLGKDDRRREQVEKAAEPISPGMREAIDDGVPF